MLTQGFGELTGDPNSRLRQVEQFTGGRPMPGPARQGPSSVGIKPREVESTLPAPAPASPTGPPPNSPLGMWQNWLKTMGPYLAQMPSSMPNQESGGLSSLAPSSTGTSLKGYSGPDTPWTGSRGFRGLYGYGQ